MQWFSQADGSLSTAGPRANTTPETPLRSPAAVSAHVNVGRVLDFYRSALMRDSVDDRGMEFVYFSGDSQGRDRTLRAIERAYAKVGITAE